LLGGRYTIRRELGRGGMATVYLAEETKHARQVAIKVLHAELAQTLGAERFLREIGIAARLSHPHLVQLIDSGDAGGLLYYVSAYVAGGSLRDRLRRERRLSVADTMRLAQEVGAGLDYAHRVGVVHRDVKPENILFADGHAMLADFGIARSSEESTEDTVTDAGVVLGTPEYMSPEQASGETQLDGRSDIYSLACVIYEALTGEPPFRGPSAQATIAMHVTARPPRIRALRPEVSPSIDDAVARALEKDPARRWPGAGEFVTAMQADAPLGGRMFRGPARSIAVLPFVNGSGEAENEYLSDGITDEVIDALAKVDGLRVASRTSVFALKGKSLDIRAIGALLNCSVVLEGTVRRSGQRLRITAQLTSADEGHLVWSQRFDRPLDDVFAIQDEIASTIVNTLRESSFVELPAPPSTRLTENVRAYGLYLKGRFEMNRRTLESMTAAIRYFEQAIEEDPTYAAAYAGLADSYSLGLDYRSVPVDEGFALAKTYARRAIELNDSLADAHNSLGWSLFIYDWDWEGAEREFRRAIELDPRYPTAHQWFAFYLASRGSLNEALVECHTAVELDPASVSCRRSLGWLYLYLRRYDQARHHLERAVEMNPGAEETLRVLGLALALGGHPADGERVLREAMELPGSGSYTSATLSYVLARAGRRSEALEIFADLESHAKRGYVSSVAFATMCLGLGDVERALDYAERSYEERRGWLAYVRVNPLMDPMRGHPRFARLVELMKLS
jgi:serine/threonine-protein kinase